MDEETNGTATGGRGEDGRRARINPKSPRESIAPEPAPPPPRSRSVRNPVVVVLNAVLTLAVLAALAAGAVVYWGKLAFDAPGPLKADSVVLIPSESGLQAIADVLETNGVIEERRLFVAGVQAYGQSRRLKAGEYAIPAGASMRDVMNLLVSGKAILHSITFPEGLTSHQIVERLKAEPDLEGPVPPVPDEGTLLPETYSFTRGTTRADILKQMADAQKKALDSVWRGRRPNDLIRTPQELVTLASIVEKETGKADERPMVAAVFLNRLEKRMRLQSDPTIIYGIAGGAGTLGRPIRRSDIDRETAYNTYHIDGLPPGPIANPGRAAMEAVAQPSVTKALYFVADGTGGHVFAETLGDHNRNVAKWRQIERRRADEGALPADQKAPDAIDVPEDAEAAAVSGGTPEAGDPLDLLDGAPRRDPDAPVLPVPKPAG